MSNFYGYTMEVKNVSNTTNGGFETFGSEGGRYMFIDGGLFSYCLW